MKAVVRKSVFILLAGFFCILVLRQGNIYAEDAIDVAGQKKLEYVYDLLSERKYREAHDELDHLEQIYPDHPAVMEMRDFSIALQDAPDETTKMELLMTFMAKEFENFNAAVADLNTTISNAQDALKEFGTDKEMQLGNAIIDGEKATVIKLLQEGVSPNTRDFLGSPIIATAISNGDIDIVKVLLDFGADPNSETILGGTILELAEKEAQFEIVDELIRRGASFQYEEIQIEEVSTAEETISEDIPFERNFVYENYVRGMVVNGPSHWYGAEQTFGHQGLPLFTDFPKKALAVYRKNLKNSPSGPAFEPMFEVRIRDQGERPLLDHMKVYQYVAHEDDFLFLPQLVKVNDREWAITSYKLKRKSGAQTRQFIRKIAITSHQGAILHLKLTIDADDDVVDGKIMKKAMKSAQFF